MIIDIHVVKEIDNKTFVREHHLLFNECFNKCAYKATKLLNRIDWFGVTDVYAVFIRTTCVGNGNLKC